MAERYNFKYLPLVGKLPGKSMVEQTEAAINELAGVVYDNVGHVGNLAEEVQTANTNASNALEKATEALETSGRVYINQIAAVDVNNYYDSELYYINNDGSTNIPVLDTGFLEVKTNDDKTACEQVFIADSTGTPYYRHGVITEQTLDEETTYVVTWGSWYRGATAEYVQAELQDYLPLSGGTMTGVITRSGDLAKNSLDNSWVRVNGGTSNTAGANLLLYGKSGSTAGAFYLTAHDGTNDKQLIGKPDGTCTWAGKNILTDATVGTILEASTSADVSLSASAAKNITSLTIPKGTWIITGHARFDSVTSGKAYGAMFGGTSASYNSNNDSAIYVHSSSTTPISIQTTRIIVQNANGTVYFVGYANAACKVLSGATFRAIRIL